jgi:hypothetical protein
MKTAKEILEQKNTRSVLNIEQVIEAMEEYASQFKHPPQPITKEGAGDIALPSDGETEQELRLHEILELFGLEDLTHEQAHKDIFTLLQPKPIAQMGEAKREAVDLINWLHDNKVEFLGKLSTEPNEKVCRVPIPKNEQGHIYTLKTVEQVLDLFKSSEAPNTEQKLKQ